MSNESVSLKGLVDKLTNGGTVNANRVKFNFLNFRV